jgi:sugar transferase (PEP-CTERM/EpsH1 system associated)
MLYFNTHSTFSSLIERTLERIATLHLITELNIGGAEKALAHLLTYLDHDRFDSTVACLYGGDGPVAGEIRARGISVVDLGMAAKWRWDALWRLYRLLREERPTILHTWMFHANIPGRVLGRLAGVPIVISGERTMGMESRWRYWLNRMTAPLADRITCVSQQVADFAVNHIGIPRHKIIVIPNGIELPDFEHPFDTAQIRSELELPVDQVLVGTIARLDPVKRLDILLHALRSLPNVYAVIIGDGPERARLTALSEGLGLVDRVHFAGHQGNVWPWLAALDVFALSSDWEGMSNALLEAMAAGLPVVATAVGGTPDVVMDGATGLLVPRRDPAALVEALASLMNDADMRRSMGQAGQERVFQHFSIGRMVEQTQDLYEQLLAAKGLGSEQN